VAIRLDVQVSGRALSQRLQQIAREIEPATLLKAAAEGHMQWFAKNFRAEGIEKHWAPLSPNTVASRRKQSSAILQDTGKMRASNTYAISGSSVEIGYGDKKAPWHHYGVRARRIVPKRAKILRFPVAHVPKGKSIATVGKKDFAFARFVNWPGIPARPLLPSKELTIQITTKALTAALSRIGGVGG
jgi:phage gpG-like protein